MGAGQIGGIATLVDIDFGNAAGFAGVKASSLEAQFVVYFLSHSVLFCAGALIEAHVVLTPAVCVYGERYKFHVFAGSHSFLERTGTPRRIDNFCIHKAYNHSATHSTCSPDNVAILVLNKQYSFRDYEAGSEYLINRVRYGLTSPVVSGSEKCHIYGWGSRRNGFLVPLLLDLYRLDVKVLPCHKCHQMWNFGNKFICVEEPPCRSEKYGALSPDDVGSALVCNGFLRGIMTSMLVDRPAGVGFLDLTKYDKFLTCAVDDSRDVLNSEEHMIMELTQKPPMITVGTEDNMPGNNEPASTGRYRG